jgi:uncharacterized protein (TIGR04255 family)
MLNESDMLSELYGEQAGSSTMRHNVAVVLLARPMTKIIINVDEQFRVLPHAPSVEAVIDIRVVPAIQPSEAPLRDYVQSKFRDYQFLDSQKEVQFQFQFGLAPASNQPPNQTAREGWKGLRFRSQDQKYIVQFNRDGFVLSRLKPYQSWSPLRTEAMRLWNGYAEFVKPVQILRVGLRYVNLISLPPGELRFEDYIEVAPSTPKGLDLPVSGFMYQDTLVVPEYPYTVNIIKTVQPPNPLAGPGYSLILDIDVFTNEPFDRDDTQLSKHLSEMRWLKNKVFFGAIKQKSERMFE